MGALRGLAVESTFDDRESLFGLSKKIFSLALPMAGSQLINVASGFLCMTMLAQLGPSVLSASALIFSTEVSIMVTGISILFSLSVLIGHAYGARNYLAIGNYVQQGWILGLLISIPIILMFWHIKPILMYFGQAPEMAEIVQTYFRAFSWSVIPEFLSVTNQQLGYSIRKKLLIVSASLASVAVLLATAYTLIFGKWGFPTVGVAGLGYARAAQNLFFFVFTLAVFYYGKSYKRYGLFQFRAHQHLDLFYQMIKIGWPICIQMGGEMLSFFVTGIMIGWLGLTSLAAFQVVNQYCFLVIISIFALSQASGILIGHACGAEQFHVVKRIGYISIAWVLIATLLVALTFVLVPRGLASFFLNIYNPENAETVNLIVLIFVVAAFSQIFDGLRHLLIGVLRGLFDTRLPMYMGLSAIWLIGMPLSYLLAFTLNIGVIGIALGGMLGMLVGALSMMYRWYQLSKRY